MVLILIELEFVPGQDMLLPVDLESKTLVELKHM
jgi:hypothetical protein